MHSIRENTFIMAGSLKEGVDHVMHHYLMLCWAMGLAFGHGLLGWLHFCLCGMCLHHDVSLRPLSFKERFLWSS